MGWKRRCSILESSLGDEGLEKLVESSSTEFWRVPASSPKQSALSDQSIKSECSLPFPRHIILEGSHAHHYNTNESVEAGF